MTPGRVNEILARFDRAKVLVVGDIYLDENIYGKVTGVSLEAPVPIFEVHRKLYNPGAAGNAACNVAALGATTYMVGVVGNDTNADIVRREFAIRNVDTSGLVVHPVRPTNTYGKLRAGGFNIPEQEVLRTDTPKPVFIDGDIERQVIANIEARAGSVDAIVVTDQVSSVVTTKVLETVVACARKHKLLTVGDSRSRIGEFRGFDIVVPNDREAGIGVGIDVVDEDSLHRAGAELITRCKNALVTCGPEGITLFAEDGAVEQFPTRATSVADVTGAGDTVTAAAAVAVVSGASLAEAAMIGNAAAAVAVARKGVVTVSKPELEEVLLSSGGPAKVRSLGDLKDIVRGLQSEGRTVVWTNGCFDILHVGHITYLLSTAKQGDVLVVGLNSDASVRRVKGPERPIVPEHERAMVMSAIECVDYITVFDDASPMAIISELKPDVYAKGGDYTIDTINQEERKIVEAYGGRIAIIPGVEGKSTTNIVQRIAGK